MYSESWTDGKRDIESLYSEGQSLDDWENCPGENLYLDIMSVCVCYSVDPGLTESAALRV
jgi:hypothetical protein